MWVTFNETYFFDSAEHQYKIVIVNSKQETCLFYNQLNKYIYDPAQEPLIYRILYMLYIGNDSGSLGW